jgi:hypothetical protein
MGDYHNRSLVFEIPYGRSYQNIDSIRIGIQDLRNMYSAKFSDDLAVNTLNA